MASYNKVIGGGVTLTLTDAVNVIGEGYAVSVAFVCTIPERAFCHSSHLRESETFRVERLAVGVVFDSHFLDGALELVAYREVPTELRVENFIY